MYGDVYYLTNYYAGGGQFPDSAHENARGFYAVILRPDEKPEVVSNFPPYLPTFATDRFTHNRDVVAGVVEALKSSGARRIALVGENLLPVKYFRQMETGLKDVAWVGADDLIHDLRILKSPAELDCMRRAGEIGSAGLTRLIEGLVRGESETVAAAAATGIVMQRGGKIYQIPCAFGPYTSLRPRNGLTGYVDEAPSHGDLVRAFVWGPFFQGYMMDIGRTAVCGGKPEPDVRAFLEKGLRKHRTHVESVRAGMTVGDLAGIGDRLLGESGDQGDFKTRTRTFGHGQGLYFERPEICSQLGDVDMVIQPGMTLSIESYIQDEVYGTAAWEQAYIVHNDRIEELNSTPYDWW
ncbi:MAG: M24 family metallopeptidase [Alphaproteobacteria bacterium]